jgi:hypothetical protein
MKTSGNRPLISYSTKLLNAINYNNQAKFANELHSSDICNL